MSSRLFIGICVFICFCVSFYTSYYKLIVQDDWAGYVYDICIGLFTGLMAGLVIYYLTVVAPRRNEPDSGSKLQEKLDSETTDQTKTP